VITCTDKSSLSPEFQDFATLIDLNASSHQAVATTNGVRSEVALSAMFIFSSLLCSPQTCPIVALLKLLGEPRYVSATTEQA